MKGIGKYKMWGEITQMCYRPNTLTWAHYTCGPINCQPVTPRATWHHPGILVGSGGPTTCPRHIHATQALAWVRVVLSRGLVCHVASTRVPRRATSARGSCRKIPPFCHFFKGLKIKINAGKIQKNPKTLEIYIFKNITPFKLKFSPLDHKFFHL